jgi:hypothetical protein
VLEGRDETNGVEGEVCPWIEGASPAATPDSRLDGSDATPENIGMDVMVGLVGMLGVKPEWELMMLLLQALVMAALHWMTTPSC